VNCRQYQSNVCVQCAQSFYMLNNLCVAQNPQCKDINTTTGVCISCYPGYTLQAGTCTIPRNIDPNCNLPSGTNCLSCRDGYWLNNGVCALVTKNCQTYEQSTGNCLTCNNSYRLTNGSCIILPSPNDPNCLTVDNSSRCLSCVDGYYVQDGLCSAVSILCLIFDYSKSECNQCKPGYFLQDGGCIYPSMGYDPYCTRYQGSFCSTCATGTFLNNYICYKVDSNCTDFDYDKSVCVKCMVGTPQGTACI
jgi:proprotein convertase subtilisin/kexin type 5